MLRLYITRHGETQWNTENRMQGSLDSPLTEKGIEQAKILGRRLGAAPITKVISSDSNRAYETAKYIIGDKPLVIETDKKLREMDLGLWEGMCFQEVEEQDKEQYDAFWNEPHEYNTGNGETFWESRERVREWLDELIATHEDENILIVTHTITLKHIMGMWDGKALEALWTEPFIHQTSLSVVEIEEGKGRILLYGDRSHLED